MKRTIVCKFGGSSLADASCFRRVRDILREDLDRRFVVVSAPGRRTASDDKLTDLFCGWQTARDPGEQARFKSAIRERLMEIVEGLQLTLDVDRELGIIEGGLARGADYAASRGEYLCARIMAEVLGAPFLDAQ